MWSDNETSEDLLGFKVHADLLIEVIKDDSVLPITIGVFGDWGSGKSSILKIINPTIADVWTSFIRLLNSHMVDVCNIDQTKIGLHDLYA